MALIVKRGRVPKTPHTEFYTREGVLALEEIHGCQGFSGAYSRKMHARRYPTEQIAPPKSADFSLVPRPAKDIPLQPLHLRTGRLRHGLDPERARTPLLVGPATAISVSKPGRSSPKNEFFRNGEAHEAWFVQEGEGLLATEYGELEFKPGQYLIVPKGTTTQWRLESPKAFFMVVESLTPIHFAPHYLNPQGQATLMAPVVETEVGLPEMGPAREENGAFHVLIKHNRGRITRTVLGHHPFDLIGWEGALYPFSFAAEDHHSLSREIHTAPPTRQTFSSGTPPNSGFSICTFRGQIEGWHPQNVPAPYAHSNVDSDEAMFFADTGYGAREGVVEPGSLIFHPGSLPHSPHGSAAARSLKSRGKFASYMVVMLDTFFETLEPTAQALACADKAYPLSWAKAR